MTTTKPTPAVDGICAALLAAGADWPAIPRDAEGKVANLPYSYASLPIVLDAVQPILRKHGILLLQTAKHDEGGWVLTTTLHHVPSRSEVVSSVPLPIPETLRLMRQVRDAPAGTVEDVGIDWHAVGSAFTYIRRYALLAALGLAPEDDDDAAAAQAARRPARARTTPARSAPAANLGVCPEHGIAYFQRGAMTSPAHRLPDDSGWCNKPADDGAPGPVGRSRVDPLRKATFDRLRAHEYNAELWPDIVGQYVPRLAGTPVRDWTPADLKAINDVLKAAEAPDYAAEDADADARVEAAQW